MKKEDFIDDSEYMETVLVAVPKNSVKEWNTKYERLAAMVVPRSSKYVLLLLRKCNNQSDITGK